jgi:hypothetical protein
MTPFRKYEVVLGVYQGRSGDRSIIAEVVASHDLWIWHAFVGAPGRPLMCTYRGAVGSMNDINVLHRSPILQAMAGNHGTDARFFLNGEEFNQCYLLTVRAVAGTAIVTQDGIYPVRHAASLVAIRCIASNGACLSSSFFLKKP